MATLKRMTRALPFIKHYIDKVKREKDYTHLAQGYFDAGYYNADAPVKLKYADSAIVICQTIK